MSPLQTVLNPESGVANLIMLHHSPDWFMDGDDVHDAFSNRAIIHLFGHKHRQRYQASESAVKLAAGAVNPSRREPQWEPGYNFIEIGVVEEQGRRWLEVDCHLRIWQSSPDRFVPKLTVQSQPVFHTRLQLEPLSSTSKIEPRTFKPTLVNGGSLEEKVDEIMTRPPARELVFRFWHLASSRRREIANQLGLLTQEDLRLPEPERYRVAFNRAYERGLMDALAKS